MASVCGLNVPKFQIQDISRQSEMDLDKKYRNSLQESDNQEQLDFNNETENFVTIGNLKRIRSSRSTVNLNDWLHNSTSFSGDLQSNSSDFDDLALSLDTKLVENLKDLKIRKFFPVQKELIPIISKRLSEFHLARPRDVCVLSPTGTGKTFAYAIPLINYLMHRVVTRIRAIVILPVNDLAKQVHQVFQSLCKNTTLKIGLFIGSTNKITSNDFYKTTSNPSKKLYTIDILVMTPGKIRELIHDVDFDLSSLEVMIIDEADRLMNETQFQWLEFIEQLVYGSKVKCFCPCFVPKVKKQHAINFEENCVCALKARFQRKFILKLLFSATLSTDPEKIDSLSLHDPIHYTAKITDTDIGPQQIIPENLKEYLVIYDEDKKPLILWNIIENEKYSRILCFTNSVYNSHRLCQLMKKISTIKVREFSSRQNIQKRTKILKRFASGSIQMIISTDMTARGIDIEGIDCVVCYDLPRNETAYIHRIGRTARAGKFGTAITIISPNQLKHFNIIMRKLHRNNGAEKIERMAIKTSKLKPMKLIYKRALLELKSDANEEIIKLKFRKKLKKSNQS
ncbi:ATP-dependent RNA helicase DDX51-like protein [Sarcoptes scabiei]|uniref:ATP-dependent RNA helicase n=1 Tax=Sarcoptes scabiei TaxID=52283 RepID=A0A132ABS7_SARSC|nr:ATP-dependent RNA helicase DDX51-like protein [Sarcoptes scabiei]